MSPLAILALACAVAAASAHGAAVKELKLAGAPAAKSSSLFATAPLRPLGLRKHSVIDEYIVGGSDARLGQFPHQASMQVVLPGFLWFTQPPQHLCGGTLIAANWVLTAAHCAYGVPSSTVRVDVVLGIDNLAKEAAGKQRIKVSALLVHGSYNTNSNGGVGPYDIALLKLSSAAKLSSNIKLALLPVANDIPTGNAVLSGWGSTSEDGNNPVYPDQLQTATFPIVDFQTAYNYISKVDPNSENPLVDTNLSVGPLDRTGLSSCSGDSGGPLIQNATSSDGGAVVIGVVSWGLANCGSIPFPSVFTRVSAYVDWIAAAQKQYA